MSAGASREVCIEMLRSSLPSIKMAVVKCKLEYTFKSSLVVNRFDGFVVV